VRGASSSCSSSRVVQAWVVGSGCMVGGAPTTYNHSTSWLQAQPAVGQFACRHQFACLAVQGTQGGMLAGWGNCALDCCLS
jgi:hypothetical protein